MRDPERIPMILAALERRWREQPDIRLGQLIVNLLRINTDTATDEEGRSLFNVDDGQILKWLGPQTEAEQTYIDEEPGKIREGWNRLGSDA